MSEVGGSTGQILSNSTNYLNSFTMPIYQTHSILATLAVRIFDIQSLEIG
jgi:hypothetical protein